MLKFATSAAVAGCLANVNAVMISESSQLGDNARNIGKHFATDKDWLKVLYKNKIERMEKEEYYDNVKGHLVDGRCFKGR